MKQTKNQVRFIGGPLDGTHKEASKGFPADWLEPAKHYSKQLNHRYIKKGEIYTYVGLVNVRKQR